MALPNIPRWLKNDPVALKGIDDYLSGKGFNEDYERWGSWDQSTYENARLYIAARVNSPKLKGNDMLTEGYFRLRQESAGLRALAWRFDAIPWTVDGREIVRTTPDHWELRVYEIEGDVEAAITNPAGELFTFS